MDTTHALEEALTRRDWDRVDALLDDSFFGCLAREPELIDEIFRSAPTDWPVAHPRRAMWKAMADAAKGPGMVVRADAVAAFRRWVRDQEAPAVRDVLCVQLAELRELVAHASHREASELVDEILANVRAAPRRSPAFPDLIPMVLLQCGEAKLVAADLAYAAECFSDAIRWATLSQEHPLGRFAREHLALVLALEERFADAEPLLDAPSTERIGPGTLPHAYKPVGLLARALVGTAALDVVAAAAALDRVDPTIINGELGWLAVHTQTRVASTACAQWDLIHRINTMLVTGSTRTGPETIAGSMLRADLVCLYQSVGDLRAAENVLTTPGLLRRPGSLTIPLARQALLRGRPEHALAILRQNEETRAEATPARHLPSGAILYATAELAVSGDVSRATLELAATTITHHRAYSALGFASSALRDRLVPLLDRPAEKLPDPWDYRERVRLTPREQEVLSALGAYSTIHQVAAALHVSPNTTKTHVRTLYRKLGAHSREEALWLGQS